MNEEKKQQVIALGRLGWSLRRIQQNTGVRRETAGVYLRSAGIAVRPPGAWGRPSPAKPAKEVITDSGAELPPAAKKSESQPERSPSASACMAYREVIEVGLSRGRNAMAIWQELIDTCGFSAGYQSARGFIRRLQPRPSPEARVVIETAPGEDYGESGVMVRTRRRSAFGAAAATHVPLLGAT